MFNRLGIGRVPESVTTLPSQQGETPMVQQRGHVPLAGLRDRSSRARLRTFRLHLRILAVRPHHQPLDPHVRLDSDPEDQLLHQPTIPRGLLRHGCRRDQHLLLLQPPGRAHQAALSHLLCPRLPGKPSDDRRLAFQRIHSVVVVHHSSHGRRSGRILPRHMLPAGVLSSLSSEQFEARVSRWKSQDRVMCTMEEAGRTSRVSAFENRVYPHFLIMVLNSWPSWCGEFVTWCL